MRHQHANQLRACRTPARSILSPPALQTTSALNCTLAVACLLHAFTVCRNTESCQTGVRDDKKCDAHPHPPPWAQPDVLVSWHPLIQQLHCSSRISNQVGMGQNSTYRQQDRSRDATKRREGCSGHRQGAPRRSNHRKAMAARRNAYPSAVGTSTEDV
jgi:hypothetical protein